MKTFLHILTATITIPLFLALILTSFIKFRLLNTNFWANAYSRPSFRETIGEKVDTFAQAYVKEQLKKEGVDIELVNDSVIENEVALLTKNLDEETVIDLLDNNTRRVLDFVNGKETRLTFFLPVEKLELNDDSNLLEQIRTNNNEYEVTKLFSHPSSDNIFSRIFEVLTQAGFLSTGLFVGSFSLFLVFTYIYFSISKRLSSLGALFIVLSVFSFLTAVPFYLAQNAPNSLEATAEPSQALLSIFLPILISGLISYILVFSGITLSLGVSGVVLDKLLHNQKAK